MSRHTSSPAEQLLGLLFGAGAALVAGLALLYRLAATRPQEIHDAQEGTDDGPLS